MNIILIHRLNHNFENKQEKNCDIYLSSPLSAAFREVQGNV